MDLKYYNPSRNIITYMDVHPGDFVLVESWENHDRVFAKIKTVAKNYVTVEENKDKIAYHLLRGIKLTRWNLDMFDFLASPFTGKDVLYTRDNLMISPIGGDPAEFPAIVSIGLSPGACKQTTDLLYVHEVQHWYFKKTNRICPVKLKHCKNNSNLDIL